MNTRHDWPLPLRYLAGSVLMLGLVALAWSVRELYRPLIIGGLIAYILMPLVTWLEKRLRWPHKLAANLVFLSALSASLSLPALIIPPIIRNLQELSQSLLDIFNQTQKFLENPIRIGVFTLRPQEISPNISDTIVNLIRAIPENALHIIENATRNFAWSLVILVTVYYLLLDWDKIREWLIRQAPEPYRKDARRLYLEIKRIWGAYLRSTLALMAIVGAFFTLTYLVIGLPGALGLGLITGLLSIIPDLGPLLGIIVAAFVAFVEGSLFLPMSNFWFAILIVGIYFVFTNIKNIWIRPRIMGRSVNLHEGLVFIIIMAAILFQGILGALIIVPVFASSVIIGRYLKRRILGQDPFKEPLIALKSYPEPEPGPLRRELAELSRARQQKDMASNDSD